MTTAKGRIEIALLKKIMRWHRRETDGDGSYDCIEVENANTRLISDSHEFNSKTGETRVVPMREAQKERDAEKCYICSYLRGLIKEAKG